MPLRQFVRAVPLASALALPAHADAQTLAERHPTDACLDAIPAASLVRVPIYLEAVADGEAGRALLPAADLLTQDVAERTRALLGATADAIPVGEPRLSWRSPRSRVVLVARRDGRLSWSVLADSARVAPRGEPIAALVARALQLAHDAGQAFLGPWPETVVDDSVLVRLELRRPSVDSTGTPKPGLPMRVAFPIATMLAPPSSGGFILHHNPPRYPREALSRGVGGRVELEYVVDAAGVPEMASVREVWPDNTARPTGDALKHHQSFVDATRRSLEKVRFMPTRLGGCAIPDLVRQPFVFGVER